VQTEVEPSDADAGAEATEFMNSFGKNSLGMCSHISALPIRRWSCALVKGLWVVRWASSGSLPGNADT
jgi:hypothetical protein